MKTVALAINFVEFATPTSVAQVAAVVAKVSYLPARPSFPLSSGIPQSVLSTVHDRLPPSNLFRFPTFPFLIDSSVL